MRSSSVAILGSALFLSQGLCQSQSSPSTIPVPRQNDPTVSTDLQAFSIEFAFFPDYAGNKSHPNEFSKNLLSNFNSITGVQPVVRVGGTSQDHAYYYPNQKENVQLIFKNPNDDQPETINYGPAFFESYHTLGNIRFFHGLNMNQNHSIEELQNAAVEACSTIGSQLELFELGNEWNFAPGEYRPANYSMQDYVYEWNNKSAAIKTAVQRACPGPFAGFLAPSFVLLDFIKNTWSAEDIFRLGYDPDNLTRELGFHNYMGVNSPGNNSPTGWDLQHTLMNHTNIKQSLASHIQRAKNLAYLGHPYVLGELNSIANQGINGETNVFGDALWLVDFSLWAGAHNIQRLHFHQGENYRYASWQPITGKDQPPTTRPPYYGQIMVASALAHKYEARILPIPMDGDTQSAYAIYDGDRLANLAIVNLRAFNQTSAYRPSREYQFKVPPAYRRARVERLTAPGSDALTNVTFAGVSYDFELARGRPVVLDGREEVVVMRDGVLNVTVPDASAVLVELS